jgi:hypothetical protein
MKLILGISFFCQHNSPGGGFFILKQIISLMEPCCSRTLIKSGKETSLVTSDWCIFVTKRKKPTVSSSRHHTQAKQKLTLVNLTSRIMMSSSPRGTLLSSTPTLTIDNPDAQIQEIYHSKFYLHVLNKQ